MVCRNPVPGPPRPSAPPQFPLPRRIGESDAQEGRGPGSPSCHRVMRARGPSRCWPSHVRPAVFGSPPPTVLPR